MRECDSAGAEKLIFPGILFPEGAHEISIEFRGEELLPPDMREVCWPEIRIMFGLRATGSVQPVGPLYMRNGVSDGWRFVR